MLRWLILSLLLTPLFDARAAGDEAAVRATFAAYKAAVLAQRGERAADNLHEQLAKLYDCLDVQVQPCS